MVTFSIVVQLKQLDSQSPQSIESVKTLYVMKSRPLKDDPVNSVFKSKAPDGQQRDVFHEVRPCSQTPPANTESAHFFQERLNSKQFHFSQIDTESVKRNYF